MEEADTRAGYPLTDLAVATAKCVKPGASESDLNTVRSIVQSYIMKDDSYEQCRAKMVSLVSSDRPIRAIRDVIECELRSPLAGTVNDQYIKKSRPWTQDEDNRLYFAVFKYGIGDWDRVAAFVGCGRIKSQCSQRWLRGIDPNLNKSTWTEAEEARLIGLVELHGNKAWTKIAKDMCNRSDVQCRYHYRQLLRSDNAEHEDSDSEDDALKRVSVSEVNKNTTEKISRTDESRTLDRSEWNINVLREQTSPQYAGANTTNTIVYGSQQSSIFW